MVIQQYSYMQNLQNCLQHTGSLIELVFNCFTRSIKKADDEPLLQIVFSEKKGPGNPGLFTYTSNAGNFLSIIVFFSTT